MRLFLQQRSKFLNNYTALLKHTQLFSGIRESEIDSMTGCLSMESHSYKKGEYVYRSGEFVRVISILAEGSLLVQQNDYWGNRSIVSSISVGDVFGEAYAMQNSQAMLNDIMATEDSTVLTFDITRLMAVCSKACACHSRIIINLMQSLSAKNRMLTQKIDCMSKRTTRDKLIVYLSEQSQKACSPSFVIPFNRQELADYLAVDRSAMSAELCRMRDAGMLTFEKNRFSLL